MRLILLFLLALCGLPALAAVVPTPLFVLHAYSQEYPWTRGQHQGFLRALEADPSRTYTFNVEYLDTKRVGYNAQYADLMGEHFRQKYADYRPAAIYVTDDNALSFALSHLDKVFPGVPVFFSGINNYAIRSQLDPAHVTGVFEKKEIAPNLRLMQQFDPDIREVVIVGDASETYRAIETETRRELAHQTDIRATFLSSQRIDELVAQLRTRKERYVFLTTLGAVTDHDGRTLTLPEVVAAIVAAGRFVVFSMEDAYLYPGVLGGYVTSGPNQGDSAAQLLVRYLDGTAMTALPPDEASPNEYVLDEAELTKAGLVLPAALAGNVRLINEQPTFYEANRTMILATLYGLVITLLVVLLTALILFARKNRQLARTSQALEKTRDSLGQAQCIARMGNWDWHIAQNRLYWSDGVFHLFGATPGAFDASYEAFIERVHPDDRDMVNEAVRATLELGAPYAIDHRIVRLDGEVRIIRETAEVVRDPQGKPMRMSGLVQDVTEQRQTEQTLRDKDAHLEFIAYHDALTTLPNRALLMERLHHAVHRGEREGGRMALLFIDLDRFKMINDSLGHAVGDIVLQTVAERLKVLVRDADTLSRLGGDEFVVLLETLQDSEDAAVVAKKIIHALEKVLVVGNHPLHISASIGISLYPEDGQDAETLMKHADAAMYKAKESGRNTFHFYELGITERAMRRIQLESKLRTAFDQRALLVFYQPLVCLESKRIYGAEALLRWFDPQEGAISPDHFIPLAEDTGLILPLGEWVIRDVCLTLKAWEMQGAQLDDFAMHVNLSVKQLMQKDLPQRLAALFAETGVRPERIVLELTESSIMESESLGLDILASLRQIGVSLAIDDFGTGHSSLSRLKQLPISELKIDRSFIRDIDEDEGDAAIVQTILALSANLGLNVIAEGVEHASQEAFLLQNGCIRAQGYYYAKPMPADALLPLLLENKGNSCDSPGIAPG